MAQLAKLLRIGGIALALCLLNGPPASAYEFGRPLLIGAAQAEPFDQFGFSLNRFDIATDGAGTSLVVSRARRFISRSTDGGKTWTHIDRGSQFDPTTCGGPLDAVAHGSGVWIQALAQEPESDPYVCALWVARSLDGGLTWEAPTLTGNPATQFAHVAADGMGTWVAVGALPSSAGGGIAVSRSVDDGLTWSSAVTVGSGRVDKPALSNVGGGTWVIVYDSFDSLGGSIGIDADILFVRSVDGGATWSAPAPLDAGAGGDSAGDYMGDLAADGATLVAVWARELGQGIMVARSSDGGVTWGPPARLDEASPGFPFRGGASVAADGAGGWRVVWVQAPEPATMLPDSDVVGVRSTDGGLTWSPPSCIEPGCATDRNRTFSSAAVASEGIGEWLVGWGTDAGLYTRDLAIARTGGPCSQDEDCLACERCDPGTERCVVGPRSSCATGGSARSVLRIRDRDLDDKDSLTWKWASQDVSAVASLGDPAASNDLTMCLFDISGGNADLLFVGEVAPDETCGGESCWTTRSDGFLYRNLEKLTPSGIRTLLLRSGTRGGKIVLRGKGAFLQARLGGLPAPALPVPLEAQVQSDTGGCLGATYPIPKRNVPGLIKARSP